MHSLPLFVKLRGRAVILLGEGDVAATKKRLLERAGALISRDENTQAAIAIVAMDDEASAIAAILRLKARGVLVNAVDRPAYCDFTLPAIVDRDPIIIAIGTGGASAGLAKVLRQRLESIFPASMGGLAEALGKARHIMKHHWPEASDRRRAIDAVLEEGGLLDPLGGGSPEGVRQWLEKPDIDGRPSRLEEIRITSDDPDELTLRAARLLGQADHIFHMRSISPVLLDRARADAVREARNSRPTWSGEGLALWLWRAG